MKNYNKKKYKHIRVLLLIHFLPELCITYGILSEAV